MNILFTRITRIVYSRNLSATIKIRLVSVYPEGTPVLRREGGASLESGVRLLKETNLV